MSDQLDGGDRQVLDEQTAADLTRSLAYCLRSHPTLFTALAESGEERWDPADPASPGIVAGAAHVGETSVTLRASPALDLEGALLVGSSPPALGSTAGRPTCSSRAPERPSLRSWWAFVPMRWIAVCRSRPRGGGCSSAGSPRSQSGLRSWPS